MCYCADVGHDVLGVTDRVLIGLSSRVPERIQQNALCAYWCNAENFRGRSFIEGILGTCPHLISSSHRYIHIHGYMTHIDAHCVCVCLVAVGHIKEFCSIECLLNSEMSQHN